MTGLAPTGVLVPRMEPGSPDWLTVMSASKIAAVLGLSPFESLFSLYHRMTGDLGDGATDATRRGHYLEPAIAAWLADQHPDWKVEETGTWLHRDRPWQAASPDRIATLPNGEVELVELKSSADGGEHWGDTGTDTIPVYYRAQVIWQLDTLGLRRCHVAVILPYLEFRSYIVEHDPDEAALMREQAQRFLAQLQRGEKPPLDGHAATYQAVRELHPDIEPAKVDTPAELAEPYLAAIVAEKDAKAAKRLASARLIDHMDTAKEAHYQGRCIARRQAKGDNAPHLVAAKGANTTDLRSEAA